MNKKFGIGCTIAAYVFILCMIASLDAKAQSVADMVSASAQQHGVNPALAVAVARVESTLNCNAVGRAGEVGPMQIKPATARGVGVPVTRGSSCALKIEASMRYLKMAIARGGASCGGISLYNRGIYARPTCTGYGRKVLRFLGRS
jgi:soluble lytic murein transglycosylase-like protein